MTGSAISRPGETIHLAGKSLPAVKYLEFFVSEANHNDHDQVSFIIDDMRLQE